MSPGRNSDCSDRGHPVNRPDTSSHASLQTKHKPGMSIADAVNPGVSARSVEETGREAEPGVIASGIGDDGREAAR